jgi:Skp family chaperone for outer membrane proteins
MKFSTFFIIFIFYFCPNYLSAEIFYVDMNKIINETTVGNYINNEFENLKKKNNVEILNNRNELKKREESLITQKKIIEESEFNNKLNVFKQDVEDFNKMTKKKNKDLQNQLLNNKTNFLKLIEPILLEYVSENNITYLLQKKYIIVGHNDLNKTSDIIELVDKKINISNFNDSISK